MESHSRTKESCLQLNPHVKSYQLKHKIAFFRKNFKYFLKLTDQFELLVEMELELELVIVDELEE